MPRPLWSGTIQISLVSFAVEVYPASNSARPIAFHEVDRRTMKRVHRQNISADEDQDISQKWPKKRETSGPASAPHNTSLHLATHASEGPPEDADDDAVRVVDKVDIVKSFEYEKGKFAIVEPQELKSLRIAGKRTVELNQFAKLDEINPALFEKPYFVFPKAGPQAKAFAVIRQSMIDSQTVGIGDIVFSGRQHLLALAPPFDSSQAGMMLYTLRFAAELRDAKDYSRSDTGVKVDTSQLGLAKQLIETFTRPFKLTEYQDQYEKSLRDLVEAKIHHQSPPTEEPVKKQGKVIDLMEALQRSLAQKKGTAAESAAADGPKNRPKPVSSTRKPSPRKKAKSA